MINKLTTFTLNLVKTNLTIVLVFYVSGFLSFMAHYRVLGIPYIAGDLQRYAEMAGKNILVIVQTFIYVFIKPFYFIQNINALNWTGGADYLWLAVVVLFLVICSLAKLFPQNSIIRRLQQTASHSPQTIYSSHAISYLLGIKFLLVVAAVLATFHIETLAFEVEQVLQPPTTSIIQQQTYNALKDGKKLAEINIDKRIKIAAQLNGNEDNFVKYALFSIPKNKDELGKDGQRLNAFMLIILIVTITAIILVQYRHYTFIKWLIFFFVFAQAILIPFNYGILGESYQYPVVSLDYKVQDNVLHKERVFLLLKSKDNLVIYDRLSFFQISYIPQSTVIHFEQIFTSSPFSNCSDGDFKPCEFYKIN